MSSVSMDPRLQARRIEVLRLRGRRRLHRVLFLVAVATVAMTLWWVIERSPLLDVDEVAVEGAVRTPPEQVVAAAGIPKGKPLVDVDTTQAKAAIAGLPWVREVTARRSVSGEVTFSITEREPVAMIGGTEGWLVVDAEGRVLERTDRTPTDLVVIGGARWRARPGDWIGESALPAVEVAALLPSGLSAKVAAIESSGDSGTGGLELMLYGGGRVLLGDTNELDEKFLSALTMLVRADIECVDTVDVRAPSVPVLTRVEGCS